MENNDMEEGCWRERKYRTALPTRGLLKDPSGREGEGTGPGIFRQGHGIGFKVFLLRTHNDNGNDRPEQTCRPLTTRLIPALGFGQHSYIAYPSSIL